MHHKRPVTYQPLVEINAHVFDHHRRPRPLWMSLIIYLRYLFWRW